MKHIIPAIALLTIAGCTPPPICDDNFITDKFGRSVDDCREPSVTPLPDIDYIERRDRRQHLTSSASGQVPNVLKDATNDVVDNVQRPAPEPETTPVTETAAPEPTPEPEERPYVFKAERYKDLSDDHKELFHQERSRRADERARVRAANCMRHMRCNGAD